MRLALTALVALTAASAAAQDGVSQDGVSVTEGDAPEEAESSTSAPIGPALLYTRELTKHDLAQKLRDEPASLGSISIGFADRGRIINAVQMPQDPAWIIERPDFSYAVQEAVDALAQVFRSVRRQFPDSAPARLNHISAKDGGYLRPHRSHQSGRDADIGLFYKGDRFPPRGPARETLLALRRGQNRTAYVADAVKALAENAAGYKPAVAAPRRPPQMKRGSRCGFAPHLANPLRGADTIRPPPPPLAIPPGLLPPEPPA